MLTSLQISAPAHGGAAAEEFFRRVGPAGRRVRRSWRIWLKLVVDRIFALAGLIALAPFLVVCALIIWRVSPGPALFTQSRVGFEGRLFKIYKLRTMHGSDGDEAADDDRIFPFGTLLRRLSIDELPQLINVLRGEMSLVGPRPHMAGQKVAGELFEDAVFHYVRRHQVMPGMTGWAQISGCRGPAISREQLARRVAHDLHYIAHWSLKFDAVILIKTVCFGFMGKPVF
jgi:lipopolysaccharide/colanic/teichoic acid biosynthesis glycosyltransferase